MSKYMEMKNARLLSQIPLCICVEANLGDKRSDLEYIHLLSCTVISFLCMSVTSMGIAICIEISYDDIILVYSDDPVTILAIISCRRVLFFSSLY